MLDSVLYPPNTNRIRDDVIGEVIQRSKSWSFDHVYKMSQHRQGLYPTESSLCHGGDSSASLDDNEVQSSDTPSFSSTQNYQAFSDVPVRYRQPWPLSAPGNRKRIIFEDAQTVENFAVAELRVRRERNRAYQARYKLKQKKKLTELENTVQHLHQEIQELQLQRQPIPVVQASHWGIVAEYLRLFRNGHNAPDAPRGNRGGLFPHETQEQRNFLQATMATDIASEAGYGVDALRRAWAAASRCYPSIDMRLIRLGRGVAESLVATMECIVTIEKNTLRYAFPHLAGNDLVSLASSLLGKRLVIHGVTRFGWEGKKGRMASIFYNADMLTPVLQLVGNLEAVCRVFSKARVSTDGTVLMDTSK